MGFGRDFLSRRLSWASITRLESLFGASKVCTPTWWGLSHMPMSRVAGRCLIPTANFEVFIILSALNLLHWDENNFSPYQAYHVRISPLLGWRRGGLSLSRDMDDTLILHSYMLSRASGFFRAGLKKEWVHKMIADANTDVPVKRYELEGDSESQGWMLIGRVSSVPTSIHCSRPFPHELERRTLMTVFQNTVSQEDKPALEAIDTRSEKPESREPGKSRASSNLIVRAFKIIFALLYEVPVTIADEPEQDLFALAETIATIMEAHDLTNVLSARVASLIKSQENWGRSNFETDHVRFLNLAHKLRSESLFRIAYIRLVNTYNAVAVKRLRDFDGQLGQAVNSGIRELQSRIWIMFYELISFKSDGSYGYEKDVNISTYVANEWRAALASRFTDIKLLADPLWKIAERYADIYSGKLPGFTSGGKLWDSGCRCADGLGGVAMRRINHCKQEHLDFARKVIRNNSAQLTILNDLSEAGPLWSKDVKLFVGLDEPLYPWKSHEAKPPLAI